MPDIMLLFSCLSHDFDKTTLRRLVLVVEALLSMTGRVTMLGLSRWTESGGSYRTLQRFFNTTVNWGKLHWLLIRRHLLGGNSEWILAGDEVVVTKSGQKTYGLDRFFSSLFGKVVPGLCFLGVSLIDVSRRCSYPLRLEPIIKDSVASSPKASKTSTGDKSQASSADRRKGRGRPKGSSNRNRRDVVLSPYLQFILGVVQQVLILVGQELKIRYFAFDGAFGHNAALQMVRRLGLELISKLRHDSALYLPHDGPYGGRGARRKYGGRLDYFNLLS